MSHNAAGKLGWPCEQEQRCCPGCPQGVAAGWALDPWETPACRGGTQPVTWLPIQCFSSLYSAVVPAVCRFCSA